MTRSTLARPQIEVGEIVRDQGDALRAARRLRFEQHRVLNAMARCRTAELGGHALRCNDCGELSIAYNSCRNRHCPKCQHRAAQRWLANREAELLPVEYYHVVFTLPNQIAEVALQNPALVYGLLFRVTGQTLTTIARDPKHLGADIGFTAVLHTWGSAMTHHPHLHCIVPGGGITPDGQWQPCKRGFLLPVRVLSRLFRRLFLEQLSTLHRELEFHGPLTPLTDRNAFQAYLQPLRQTEWVVYAKRPFDGPEAVLKYLSLYTHRVAISNSRLTHYDQDSVTFKYKDYRKQGKARHKTMQLSATEFLRRFLIHVLPQGFHRIRHFGLFANHQRKRQLERLRTLLDVFVPEVGAEPTEKPPTFVCLSCGTPLIVIEILHRPRRTRAPP